MYKTLKRKLMQLLQKIVSRDACLMWKEIESGMLKEIESGLLKEIENFMCKPCENYVKTTLV
jgi:hypothetical protein